MKEKLMKMYRDCFDAVKEKMGKNPGGDADGVFFFFPKSFEVKINRKEAFMDKLEETELVKGVFYTFNRKCNSDLIILSRGGELYCHSLPYFSEDLSSKLKENIEKLKAKNNLYPVLMKRMNDEVVVIPKGLTSTRFVNCKMERIATVAAEMSHCRVYH